MTERPVRTYICLLGLPHAAWFEPPTFISSQFWRPKPKIKVLASSVSPEASLLRMQVAASCRVLTWSSFRLLCLHPNLLFV